MKRRFSSFIGMILVCAVTIAQTSISLLPKPQLRGRTLLWER